MSKHMFYSSIDIRFSGANTGEFIQLKLTNLNFQVSHSEMQKMIKRADLESHGYIKEVTSKLVKEPASGETDFQVGCYFAPIIKFMNRK